MQFLVEHQREDDVQIAVCETLSDVQLIAGDLVGEGLELGLSCEGELYGEWGVFRYAPAA